MNPERPKLAAYRLNSQAKNEVFSGGTAGKYCRAERLHCDWHTYNGASKIITVGERGRPDRSRIVRQGHWVLENAQMEIYPDQTQR